MDKIIHWMNANNGFLIVILTLIYVIATILICVFNYISAHAARKQTEESKRQFRESNRPYVIPCFTMIEGALFCLTFKNIGNECAKELEIKINDNWMTCFDTALKKKKMPGNLKKSLENKFFLVPNEELKFVLMIPGDGTCMYNELCKEKIQIDIEYSRNDLSEKFKEHFDLDLVTMAGLIIDKSDFIRKMEKQEKVLKEISKSTAEIVKAIKKEKENGKDEDAK